MTADTVIEEIDAGTLHPRLHVVVRTLHQHMTLTEELQREALMAFDRGDRDADMAVLRTRMWAKIGQVDVAEQSGLRLSNCLTRPDEAVDWHSQNT